MSEKIRIAIRHAGKFIGVDPTPVTSLPAVGRRGKATPVTGDDQFPVYQDRDQPGAFSQFVRMFVHEAPDLVRKMEQAQQAGDVDELGKSAHYLRSAALAMGASQLVEVCHGLEHHDLTDLQGSEMAARFDQLRRAVRDALILLLQEVPQI